MSENFFDEQAAQSKIKSMIVSEYFESWANVMSGATANRGQKTVCYIDLFAGPGRYKDGAISTPIQILQIAVKNKFLREHLVCVFNDKDKDTSSKLKEEISKVEGIEALSHQPQVACTEIGNQVVEELSRKTLVPSLFFVDPWGYKGLSLKLINSVLKDFGSECIVFFNFNRINMGVSNSAVFTHMAALFGEAKALELKDRVCGMDPAERELTIIESVCQALVQMGGKYVLPFAFKNERGTRTKHHLIFVSKHDLGYTIMKNVMYKSSSSHDQGVASFEYNPATKSQPLLFELTRPLDDLEEMLLNIFQGRTITMKEIYKQHNYGLPYIERNYKDVLLNLEEAGKITATPHATKRRKHQGRPSCALTVSFSFPAKT